MHLLDWRCFYGRRARHLRLEWRPGVDSKWPSAIRDAGECCELSLALPAVPIRRYSGGQKDCTRKSTFSKLKLSMVKDGHDG
jgi:hypothetical protein